MHMSDALLSAAVGGTMVAVSTGFLGYSVKKINKIDIDDKKIPMMGVMGAFIFASQMINFTIPLTGSSGHIGGGVLLAALLGPYPAMITMACVLLIQSLFFADGGLLALGCNIFNMGVIACFIAYPLIYKPIIKKGMTARRLTIASILAVVVGLQLGAFAVVLETTASGITQLPFTAFLTLMQPIHLLIGLVEGIVTAAVLVYIAKTRKEILESSMKSAPMGNVPIRKVLLTFIIITALVGGILSIYASSNPDGLVWSIKGVTGLEEVNTDSDINNATTAVQDKTALLPNYKFKTNTPAKKDIGTGISGIVGGIFTLSLAVIIGVILHIFKKRYRIKSETE